MFDLAVIRRLNALCSVKTRAGHFDGPREVAIERHYLNRWDGITDEEKALNRRAVLLAKSFPHYTPARRDACIALAHKLLTRNDAAKAA